MDFKNIFNQFNNKRILVIGDVMIDAYILGAVTRVSPEAPVPIVNFQKSENRLGGAANVALNLVALGAKPVICSVIGKDSMAKVMLDLIENSGVDASGVITSDDRLTTVKTRVIGNKQQLIRIDQEEVKELVQKELDAVYTQIEKIVQSGVDAIIFEDYNKGVLVPELIAKVVELANKYQIPTTVDPKKDHFLAYQGVTLFKPNLKELREGLDMHVSFDSPQFQEAVLKLEEKLQNKISFITLSELGVFIKDENQSFHIPAHLRNITDVSGAGDTVISVATLCLSVGLPIELIGAISNIAGGLVCEKNGVVSIDKEDLLNETIKLLGK